MKKLGSLLWGSVLIALGVILALNALGVAEINIFFPGWWTLFIIVPCAIGVVTEEHKASSLVGLLIGVALLLGRLDIISFAIVWKMILPLILVIVGIYMIVRSTSNAAIEEKIRQARKARARKENGAEVAEGEVVEGDADEDDDDDDEDWERNVETYCATFGDQKINYDGKKFSDCRLGAIFGSTELDLRQAKIENGAVIRVTSIFGKAIVKLPQNVKVEMASSSIFGEVKDLRARKTESKAGKTLYIDAKSVFGGIEIR